MGVTLVVLELCAGLVLHIRAGEKRDLVAVTEEATKTVEPLKKELTNTLRDMTKVERNIVLAKQLRETHRWSRLLSALAQTTPQDIVLNSIATDPPRWAKPKRNTVATRKPAKAGSSSSQVDAHAAPRPAIQGILVRGHAASHEGLSVFMTMLHASSVFSAIDLRQMRSDQLEKQETVSFELRGQW